MTLLEKIGFAVRFLAVLISPPISFTEEFAMSDRQHTRNWPELAVGLYDRLTGNNAEISYEFENMHVQIPSGTGDEAEHAEWVLDGRLKVTTSDKQVNSR